MGECGAFGIGSSGDAAVDRSKIESIIREYVNNNTEEIVLALTKYQEERYKKELADVIEANKEYLYDDTDTPVLGSGSKKLVVFYDYFCDFCGRYDGVLSDLLEGSDVKVILRPIPVMFGENSAVLAKAVVVFNKWYSASYDFASFHRELFKVATEVRDNGVEVNTAVANLLKDTKFNFSDQMVEGFKEKMSSEEPSASLEKNIGMASLLMLRGTPLTLCCGEMETGFIDADVAKKMLSKCTPPSGS